MVASILSIENDGLIQYNIWNVKNCLGRSIFNVTFRFESSVTALLYGMSTIMVFALTEYAHSEAEGVC